MEVYVSIHTNLSILYVLFGCWGSRMEASDICADRHMCISTVCGKHCVDCVCVHSGIARNVLILTCDAYT